MALNIKNPRTEELAHLISRETGESLTQAVTVALEERLERLRGTRRGPDLVDEIMQISQRCSSLPVLDSRSSEEILEYDERGVWG